MLERDGARPRPHDEVVDDDELAEPLPDPLVVVHVPVGAAHELQPAEHVVGVAGHGGVAAQDRLEDEPGEGRLARLVRREVVGEPVPALVHRSVPEPLVQPEAVRVAHGPMVPVPGPEHSPGIAARVPSAARAPMGGVLRVWLDQNKWIDLARAVKGDPRGGRYTEVLDVVRACAGAGEVSLPLDAGRYMETAKRGDWTSRQELAATMAELSRYHAIAPPRVVVPAEIDAALHARFGVPDPPRTAQIFGVGARHVFSGGIDTSRRLRLPEGLDPPPGWRAAADDLMQRVLEHALLLGPPPEMQASDEHQALLARMTQDDQFARARTELALRLAQHGFEKKDKLDRAMLANELVDILAPINDALRRARIDPDRFIDALGWPGLTAFVRDLPTRSVTLDLLRDKHAQGQQKWEPNDLNDVVYLPVAAVHCDVVVTEKQWANRLSRAGVPGRYGTTVLSDLAELTGVLVAKTRMA